MPAGEALAVCGLPLSWPLPRVNTAVQLAPPSVETSAWQNSPSSSEPADIVNATDTALSPAVATARDALAVKRRRNVHWRASTLTPVAQPAMPTAKSVVNTVGVPAAAHSARDQKHETRTT